MALEASKPNDPQNAVIHLAQRLAGKLVDGHRERLCVLLRDISQTYDCIAQELIPDSVVISLGGARAIIRFAAVQVLEPEEYRENVFERLSRSGRQAAAAFGFGVGDSLQKAHATMGRVAWTDDEQSMLFELLNSPQFHHPAGSASAGKPIYSVITQFLNDVFHGGKNVRTIGTLRRMRIFFLDQTAPDREKARRVGWTEDEEHRLQALAQTCWNNGDSSRGPDLVFIAATLNREFHSAEFDAGIHIRNSGTCFKKLESLDAKRVKVRRFPWSPEENARFLHLCGSYIHESGNVKGRPRYEDIANTLNAEFHAAELALGNIIRTPANCSARTGHPPRDKKA